MLIIFPIAKVGLSQVEKEMSSENLQKWTNGLQPQKVVVHLPKFKMTSEFGLKEAMKSMGLSLAFSDNADFSRISNRKQFYISFLIHKTFVNVSEEGTEAAVATGGGGLGGAARLPNEPVEFRADHPFVFLVRHNPTQSTLFLGRVMNPDQY